MDGTRICVVAEHDGVELCRHEVGLGEHIIGRAPDCGIVVDHQQVSRHHARLVLGEAGWTIEDLGSANGTRLDGRKLCDPAPVGPGARIRMGSVTIELRAVSVPAMPAVVEAAVADAPVVLQAWLTSLEGRRRYEVGSAVARGGMGTVLSAVETATGRTVAMKVMSTGATEEDSARFLTEAKVTAQLEHPNIVPVHELGVDEQGRAFYTMKLVKGESLGALLHRIGNGDEAAIRAYPLNVLLGVFLKVCDAVAFAHSRSVLHRDLKPDNIMIGPFGEVLVLDWGLAKVLARKLPRAAAGAGIKAREVGAFHTVEGMVLGTPQYMAPEQAEGLINQIDQRTDVYALGAILYHILALRPPVADAGATAMIEKAAAGCIAPPASHRRRKPLPHCPGGRIPDALSAVAMRALSKSRAARYPTVQSLQQDIVSYQAGFATLAERAGAWRRLGLWVRRHKVVVGIVIVLALLAAIAAVFRGFSR